MTSSDSLPNVAIAVYQYRHEAEFAAGFLDHAGIPYRLQIDDAGGADAGMTVSNPARLWVRSDDVAEALELLEIEQPTGWSLDSPRMDVDSEPAQGTFIAAPANPGHTVRRAPPGHRLCFAERGASAAIAVLSIAGGLATGASAAGAVGSFLPLLLFALAAVFGFAALFGRAWGPFRSILRALSGVAP